MFEIGFPELILIAIIGLLVIGPERLPEALRTLGLWVGRMRRSFTNVKTEIEKEIGMDEIRRQLHNEAVMEEMKRIERDVRNSVNSSSTDHRPAAAGTPAGSAEAIDKSDGDTDLRPDGEAGERLEPLPSEPPQDPPASVSDDERARVSSAGADDTRHG